MTTQEQIDLILGPQLPIGNSWFDTTELSMAKSLGPACPAVPPADPNALNDYVLHLQYYDLPLSERIVYERTKDPQYLNYFRNAADSWWQHPNWIKSGAQRDFYNGQSAPPRHGGIMGLILRALDGRPEMWDFIVEYVRAHADIWLLFRLKDPALWIDIREGAFTLHYMVLLSQALPDSYPLQAGGTATNGAQIRAEMLANAEKVVTDYYQRLQYPCGCWRYNAELVDPDDGGTLVGITQPFTIGLLMMAFADLDRVTTNTTVKASIKNQMLKVLRHLYVDGPYRKNVPTPFDPSKRWRDFWYLWHGGTTVNPTRFETGGWSLPGTNANEISDARQSIGPIVAAYGYAYKISGDPLMLEAGNEMWDAAYVGTDGIRNLMNTDGKGFNQNARRAGSYPAWIGGAMSSTTTTTTTRSPSPDGTKATLITDNTGAVWTLGAEQQTLKDGVQFGRGAGSIYKFVSGVVYILGTDSSWYKADVQSATWIFVGAEPGSATPSPTPAPTPSPAPQPAPAPASRAVYEYAKFNFSTEATFETAVKNASAQGYGSCVIGPSGKVLYCLRVKQ